MMMGPSLVLSSEKLGVEQARGGLLVNIGNFNEALAVAW